MAPDGTGGFRGITIAVSAILLALKNNRSPERILSLSVPHGFSLFFRAQRVFVSSQSNAVNGCRLAKLNNKGDVSALTVAIRGQLRSGRVGRMPSERGLRVFD